MNRWLRVLFVLCFGAVLAFAFRMPPPGLTRGPFLQDLSETEVSVVFKTSATATPVVRYGTTFGAPWQFEKAGTNGTTHVIRLTNLKPETRYYYEITAGTSVIRDEDLYYFRTAPPEKSRAPFRFAAFGDSGVGSTTQYDVSNRMAALEPAPELVLGLGDLVYDSGAAADFDPKLFKPNEKLFPRVAFWPTLGNHDASSSNGAPFYEAFYLPTTTGAPGKPSNTERYYSFDHGMAHFVCIDSQSSSMSSSSAMYQWAAADIDDAKARGKRWIFAFMHHPPYSRGTHGDDSEVRDNLVPMFEAKGVDMVLAGHSHVYERSFLAKGNAPIQNDADTYTKIGSPNGTIYLVSGCAGKTGSGSLDHQIMSTSYGGVAGFSSFDVTYDEIHGYFIQRDGKTTDVFTVRKAADTKAPRVDVAEPVSATEVVLSFNEPVEAGTGASGAANVANYLLAGGAVTGATLADDEHTVRLTTSSLTPNKSYELSILRVKDASGNAIDQRAIIVLEGAGGGGGGGGGGGTPTGSGVPEGATWRYFKGTSAPPANWTAKSFVDTSWAQGKAGFGFADSDDATVLSDMLNGYVSVYTRTAFTVDDPARITGMNLRVLYDDGFVAYLNGTEVARANMPAGQTNTTMASASHEADAFETFDIGAFKSSLTPGTNVLAVMGANNTLSSSDFSLHPALSLLEAGSASISVGPPVAKMDVDVLTANVPARIDFSSEGSADDGSIVSKRWHFGDGTASTEAATSQHLFDREGIFVVSLIVKDNSGLESVDQKSVRIHAQGSSPQANMTASDNQIDAGATVQFGSAGSQDPDGGPVYILWDFDDPASGVANAATTASASHRFAVQGTYDVTLSITDDEGSTDTQVSRIVVGAGSVPAPTPAFSVDVTSGQAPLLVHFTDQTTGDVTSWSWSFGDGSTSTAQNPTHTYNQTGNFTVQLQATGPGGSDSTSQVDLIEVVAAGQVAADFSVTRTGLQVTFSDDSTGDVTSWAWNFGDGATSTQQAPVHTYAVEGDYLVTLTVTGPNGTDAKQRLVEVTTSGGGAGGGGCYAAIGEGPGPKGDPSLALMIALVLAALAFQRKASRRSQVALSLRS